METTRVIFNVPKAIKAAAMKRAKEENDTLTSILAHTLHLYGEGAYDPDDFLTKEDLASIEEGLADMHAGRVVSLKDIKKEFDIA